MSWYVPAFIFSAVLFLEAILAFGFVDSFFGIWELISLFYNTTGTGCIETPSR
jgi:hypothetical protein